MTLSLKVFGFEVASVELDLPEEKQSPVETVVDKAIGATTKLWLGRLFK